MNQIRHIFNACFLLFIIFIVVFLIKYTTNSMVSMPAERGTQDPNPIQNDFPSNTIGKSLFQQNCQTCHALDKDLTGPALRGFTQRGPWSDRKEIYKWVRNPAAYIKQNKYAASLQKQYVAIMQSFDLTNEEIDHIVNYIESATFAVDMPVALR